MLCISQCPALVIDDTETKNVKRGRGEQAGEREMKPNVRWQVLSSMSSAMIYAILTISSIAPEKM
jgi:hypothetical protein